MFPLADMGHFVDAVMHYYVPYALLGNLAGVTAIVLALVRARRWMTDLGALIALACGVYLTFYWTEVVGGIYVVACWVPLVASALAVILARKLPIRTKPRSEWTNSQ